MLAIQLFHRVSITKTKPKLEFDSQNDVSASVTVDVYDFLPSPPATETETVPHDDQVHDDSSSSEDNDVIRKSNYLKEKQRVERSTNRDEKSIQEVHSSPDKYEKIADHESEDRAPPIRKASDKPLREDDDFETLATALLAPRKPQNRPKNTQRKVTQTTKRSNRQSRISEEMRSRADLMQEKIGSMASRSSSKDYCCQRVEKPKKSKKFRKRFLFDDSSKSVIPERTLRDRKRRKKLEDCHPYNVVDPESDNNETSATSDEELVFESSFVNDRINDMATSETDNAVDNELENAPSRRDLRYPHSDENIGLASDDHVTDDYEISQEVLTDNLLNSEDSSSANSDNDENNGVFYDDSSEDSTSDSESTLHFHTNSVQGNRTIFPATQLKVADVLLMIISLCAAARLTQDVQSHLVEMMKICAGPDFELWNASNHYLSQIYNPSRDKMTAHFFCNECGTILISRPLNHKIPDEMIVTCEDCGLQKKINKNTPHQFLTIDMKYQLNLLLNEPDLQEDMIETVRSLRERPDDMIKRDIFDGDLYKNIQKHHPGTLTFNVSTDGAPLSKSGSRSFWPIQLHVNEMSTKNRFSHILLAGLFLTDTEPNSKFMDAYFSAFF
ncbi:uncharacterized protein LOC107046705 [Diachasma alloeum]|uniref:uncharacterized protein LOC107046705 n=1 Tax=Diachasma alloeum TaxID=454923 RepID=UPI0007383734|nr:uncharacterized protein LOC107046705 [Diachasma alloeum]